jgi:hypothetical protein
MKVFHGLKDFNDYFHRQDSLLVPKKGASCIGSKPWEGFLRMIGSFFTCGFLRTKEGMVGRLALLLGSGLSSEVNKEGSPSS